MLLDPETALILFVVGGVFSVATFTLYKTAEEAGPRLSAPDLLPAPPWEGLPIPRGFYTKPEVMSNILRGIKR